MSKRVDLSGLANSAAIANGVLNPASFAVNPDGTNKAFTLFIQPLGR